MKSITAIAAAVLTVSAVAFAGEMELTTVSANLADIDLSAIRSVNVPVPAGALKAGPGGLPAANNSELSPADPGASDIAPDALVRTLSDEVLKSYKTATTEELLALLQPYCDFERMTEHAMGKKFWEQATEEQRKNIVKEFRMILARTFSGSLKAISMAGGLSVEVKPLGPQQNPDEALVNTVVKVYGQTASSLDYRLNKKGAAWKVSDVLMSGFSAVTTYRSQFAAVIGRSGIDGLINALAEKNKK